MMKIVHIALAFAATSCGCVHGATAAPTPPAAPAATSAQAAKDQGANKGTSPVEKQAKGRVATKWQEMMFDKLAKDPVGYQQAWGLFSEGGWANAGQVMIYGDSAQTKLHAVVIEPEGNQIGADKELTSEAFAPVAKEVKAAEKLGDLDMVAFDALTFEYVHAVKDASGKVAVDKRVLIRNAGQKHTQAYDALVAAFQKLRTVKK